MTAPLFAKDGEEYIRVSTSVPKPDGSGRAVGTVLAGLALESIKAGNAYYGQVAILGKILKCSSMAIVFIGNIISSRMSWRKVSRA